MNNLHQIYATNDPINAPIMNPHHTPCSPNEKTKAKIYTVINMKTTSLRIVQINEYNPLPTP